MAKSLFILERRSISKDTGNEDLYDCGAALPRMPNRVSPVHAL